MNTQKTVQILNSESLGAMESRVTELEMRLAFQEDTLQTLNQQLVYQQSVIEQQQQTLQAVYRQLTDIRSLSDNDGAPQEAQEKPPHY